MELYKVARMGFKVIQGLEDLATKVSLALINLVAKRPDSSNQRQTSKPPNPQTETLQALSPTTPDTNSWLPKPPSLR